MSPKYLKVINNRYCGESYHSSEQFGDWFEHYSNDVKGIELLSDEKKYHDLVVDYDLKEGDIVYLVYGTYSTGDSFGSCNGCIEFVDVFKTEQKAWDCRNALVKEQKDKDGNTVWSVEYLTESDKTLKFHVPWFGYFEHLDDVYVVELIVEKEGQCDWFKHRRYDYDE